MHRIRFTFEPLMKILMHALVAINGRVKSGLGLAHVRGATTCLTWNGPWRIHLEVVFIPTCMQRIFFGKV